MTFSKLCLALALPAGFGALAGCNGPGTVGAAPPPAISEVHTVVVQILPAAVNWDGRPGPDGLEVTVRLFRHDRELPVTITGALEFLLYEGVVSPNDLDKARPAHTWRFSDAKLRECLTRSVFGWGYSMRLGWAEAVPQTSSVTLLTRYLPPEGRPVVSSSPMSILIRPR